jgi:hypothetical protein
VDARRSDRPSAPRQKCASMPGTKPRGAQRRSGDRPPPTIKGEVVDCCCPSQTAFGAQPTVR